jgi:hypothetical protein
MSDQAKAAVMKKCMAAPKSLQESDSVEPADRTKRTANTSTVNARLSVTKRVGVWWKGRIP